LIDTTYYLLVLHLQGAPIKLTADANAFFAICCRFRRYCKSLWYYWDFNFETILLALANA